MQQAHRCRQMYPIAFHANDISSCMALLLSSDQSVAILLNSCAWHGGFM